MKIAVIGGAGRMGKLLSKYFIDRGFEVLISDIRQAEAELFADSIGAMFAENNVAAVESAETIVLSTPINVMPYVLDEISQRIKPSTTLVEISSVKSGIMPKLRRIAGKGVCVISLHPLFGPGAQSFKGGRAALIPVEESSRELVRAKNLFPDLELIIVDSEEHDKVMALTLSLTHFVNIIFASTIIEEDINLLKRLGGTTFTLQLVISEGVMSEDPAFYAHLQADNPYTIRFLEKFFDRARMMKDLIDKKDLDSFKRICIDIRENLAKDEKFSSAYERMYKALNAL
ncbi:MAG: prephenate dehydrogenase/arogenate dehydrogenase family protein [Nitrososphaerota archaeon]|nr:prephenate dehydrogenase/arogenate dehydrogenase family protein [Candidatus Bathyarchaeota archaeon]MDW8048300.1 prephenate dehydrogenase/arogenate dehydrogenase family protein [Nitrososphaerota archaeon]